MTGLFELRTASDLREKLRRDLEKLKGKSLNTDLAFNFFVTAEHMLDWVYPKDKDKQTATRKASRLLQVCFHLGNGAKHFEVQDKRHDSVSSADTSGGYFPASYFSPSYFPNSYFGAGRRLVVTLKGKAAIELGSSFEVVDLATKVMEYWDAHSLT